MTCADLVAALNADEDMPYGAWSDGRGITTRDLGRKLMPYRIRAKKLRVVEVTANGYEREQFEDSWNRYLPLSPAADPEQPAQPASLREKPVPFEPEQMTLVPVSESGANTHGYADVPVVPLSDAGYGDEGENEASYWDGEIEMGIQGTFDEISVGEAEHEARKRACPHPPDQRASEAAGGICLLCWATPDEVAAVGAVG
jgi:uncharacterized protein DUF3631